MNLNCDEYVNVGVRIRPSNNLFCNSVCVISDNPPVLLLSDRQQTYSFDSIFRENAKQQDVYREMVKPLIRHVESGYNCTVFAYGQTGTGKSYTIGSDIENCRGENSGFISRTLDDFFNITNEEKTAEISVSFLEIYNEKVYDLLSTNKVPLSVKGFKVPDLNREKICDSYQGHDILQFGIKNRHVGKTKQNSKSSRSHAIFSIHCNIKSLNDEVKAKLNLVDLAGSESVGKTGNQGTEFVEGININKGLLSIGQVIKALSVNSSHVPYRQSMITTILQDSLNRTNYITLVACISPQSEDIQETVQTLEFSQRAKKVRNKPEINSIIQEYQKENMGSACKIRRTPMKRPNGNLFQSISTIKKPRLINSTLVSLTTPAAENSNNLERNNDSCRSLSSVNLSSISTGCDILQNLSPFAKKVAEALESRIFNKAESIVRAHILYTPLRDAVEYSPKILREKANTEFSKGSSRDGEDLKFDNIDSNKEKEECTLVRKQLDFSETNLDSRNLLNENECVIFKIPDIPVKAVHKSIPKDNSVPKTSSPIRRRTQLSFLHIPDFCEENKSRRSLRLSIKKRRTSFGLREPIESVCRKSTRLSIKKMKSTTLSPVPAPRNNGNIKSTDKTDHDVVPVPAPRKTVKRNATSKRKKNLTTEHCKKVLDIINCGNEKELQKLATVGIKTASQIVIFRMLHGKCNSISELSKMGSWRGKGFENFLKANHLI